MGDKINIPAPVRLGGKRRFIKYTLGALKRFQELAGTDILADEIVIADMDAEEFRDLVYCGLLDNEPHLKQEKARRWVSKKNAVELLAVVITALKMAMPDPPSVKEGEVPPPKEEPKPTDWLVMWRYGRYCLRLSEQELWSLTPAQFYALTQEQAWDEYREAFLCSCFANYLRDPKKQNGLNPDDFMPARWGKREAAKMTGEQLTQKIDAMMTMLGGEKPPAEVKPNG
jgi:hypothetical protein